MFKVCIFIFGLLIVADSYSQSLTPPTGGPYTLAKQVIAAGGARACGDNYVLTGAIAQANAGPSSGAGYILNSGFHTTPATAVQPDPIFKNGFEN